MTQDQLFTIAAVITASGVIIGGLLAIYRVARRIGDAIGVDSKGRTVSERLERVEHQLWENGGSSLADRVNSIDKCVGEVRAEVTLLKNFVIPAVTAEPVNEIKAKRTRTKKAM